MKRFVIACLSCVAVAPVVRAQEAVPEIPFTANVDPVKLPAGGTSAKCRRRDELEATPLRVQPHGRAHDRARRDRRRSCSSSVRTARSFARSDRTSTALRSLIRCASTRTTTSGRRTKGRTWSSSSVPRGRC